MAETKATARAFTPSGKIINPRSHNVNEMGINQLATVLNSIVSQATGQKTITPTNTAEFISVANAGLMAGYDSLLQAITQVMNYTIFSVRPYYAKYVSLKRNREMYGNHVRKLQVIDSEWEMDNRFEFENGDSVDMYVVKKPEVLQTNFYGQNVFKRKMTVFRDQLNTAFRSPDEFGRFMAMLMTNVSDMIEQCHEVTARFVLNNFIAGKIASDAPSCIHLLTEYNTETGLTLNKQTVLQPVNYDGFIRWLYGRLSTLMDYLTDRSVRYHVNIDGKPIMRHTPVSRQRLFVYSPIINRIRSTVLTQTYHENFLRLAANESVNFWQSADAGDSINVTPIYLDSATGNVMTATEAVDQSGIFGVIMDEEAAGITTIDEWSARTPFNADGGYSNIFWHFTDRYWNDFTENGIVLLMD